MYPWQIKVQGNFLGLLDRAQTLQTTLLLRATQLRASALHVDRENNYIACVMHI